ncbi:hypothetical protein FLJC2902T_22720 [Flavobacterium limnosediminis JC2902]|uniref:Uncharacterized protein n=1 Tax=Flavobacterium limnosediminis JC2902 TaxID=1341181 RepID=V6SKW9_9FLAO|nr:hypothetical protein [Flavobacterium limnosediminis]ESU27094.1 hypothetical protein FLJC2902T_22720 [Flavobacterium limnosediminis JC2902]
MEEQIDKGFVKLKRTYLEWEWYQDGNTFRLMIHLLLKSNYISKRWQGNIINPGELITSLNNLSKELKLSENVIRTSLNKLKKTGYIVTKSTNRFTKITILKSTIFDKINSVHNEQNNNQSTIRTQTTNNQPTTTNKVNKEKDIKERIDLFQKEIFQFKNKFSIETLNSFFKYWTEENRQTGRLKFENEEFWNLETRLSNWKTFGTNKPEKKQIIKNR